MPLFTQTAWLLLAIVVLLGVVLGIAYYAYLKQRRREINYHIGVSLWQGDEQVIWRLQVRFNMTERAAAKALKRYRKQFLKYPTYE